jgi:hypothetical protein
MSDIFSSPEVDILTDSLPAHILDDQHPTLLLPRTLMGIVDIIVDTALGEVFIV